MALALSPAIATRAIWKVKSKESFKDYIPQDIPWRQVGSAVGLVIAVLILASILVRL